MRKFSFRCVFSLSFTLFTELIHTRSEYVASNVSLSNNQNITINILKSKEILNTTDEIDPKDLYEIYHNNTELSEEDYADFSALHPEMAEDLYRIAQKKNLMAEIQFNKTVGRQGNKEEAYYYDKFFISKAMDLMTQSVYATRLRLRDTRELRKKFNHRFEYGTALIYGSMMQLRLKMDNLYATMKKFTAWKTKFMWYLVLYEKCLSFNVDISQMVKDVFEMQTQFHSKLAMEHDEHRMDGPPAPSGHLPGHHG